jgi:hypothetical protein
MWIRKHSQVYNNITKEKIWDLWKDVNNWHKWDNDIEHGRIDSPFAVGNYFFIKPKGMSEINLQLVEVEEKRKYTDLYKFFGAKLYGSHEIEELKEGVRLTTSIKVTGPLKFIWIKLVARGIVDTLPDQMEALVKLAKER